MSDENTIVVAADTDDLDAFTQLFEGRVKESIPEVVEDATPDDQDDTPAPEELDLDLDDDTDEPEPEPKPKPKSKAQERIEELNGKYREEERKRLDLERRIAELEASQKQDKKEPVQTPVDTGLPSPDDKSEDGEDKYPLGEFDPKFIRDLNRAILKEERDAMRKEELQERETRSQDEAKAQLVTEWEGKLEAARQEYPDLDEKNEALEETFTALEPSYAEYLASTIMSMDSGPEVLYYLANNPDEAKRIVSSGPAKATIALGRLEAILDKGKAVEEKPIRVSNAPTPPPVINKGSSGRNGIRPDTDDLDAFERAFFTDKKRF